MRRDTLDLHISLHKVVLETPVRKEPSVVEPDFYKRLLDDLYDGVYFVDRHRRITYWNRGAERLSGYASAEMLGRYCWHNRLRHMDERGQSLCWGHCPLAATLMDGLPREAEVYLHHKSGHRVPVLVRVTPIREATGAIAGAVEVFSDNSVKTTALQIMEDLRQLSLLDALTNLGNRRYIESHLQARLDELGRYNWPFGVLMIDIDWFKQVNDTHGHQVGDDVLRMVANTLAHNVRTGDVIGRWGGEEFVIALRAASAEQLSHLAERLRLLVERSALTTKTAVVQVTVSVGMTLARSDDTIETLLQRADKALYLSKSAGRNRVTVADASAPAERHCSRWGTTEELASSACDECRCSL